MINILVHERRLLKLDTIGLLFYPYKCLFKMKIKTEKSLICKCTYISMKFHIVLTQMSSRNDGVSGVFPHRNRKKHIA